jgi:hypothetical protein
MQHSAWRVACWGSCRLGTRRAPLPVGVDKLGGRGPGLACGSPRNGPALTAIDRGKKHDQALKPYATLTGREYVLGRGRSVLLHMAVQLEDISKTLE